MARWGNPTLVKKHINDIEVGDTVWYAIRDKLSPCVVTAIFGKGTAKVMGRAKSKQNGRIITLRDQEPFNGMYNVQVSKY